MTASQLQPPSEEEIVFLQGYIQKYHPNDAYVACHSAMEQKKGFFGTSASRRLLVITQFRFFIFGGSSKSIQNQPRDFHLYDILKIESSQGSVLTVKFRPPRQPRIVYKMGLLATSMSSINIAPPPAAKGQPTVTPERPKEEEKKEEPLTSVDVISFQCGPGLTVPLCASIINAYQNISMNFPPEFACGIHMGGIDLATNEPPVIEPSQAFLKIYRAWCNYYMFPPHPEFLYYLEALYYYSDRDMDLTQVPGIDPRSEAALNLWPVMAALRFDTYFKSIKLHRYPRKELVFLMADVLRNNTCLTRIDLEEVAGDERLWCELGSSLGANTKNNISMIRISDSTFTSRAVASLAMALSTFDHSLTHLELPNCSIAPRGVAALFAGLAHNWAVSLSLEHLDLSGNSMDREGTVALENWMIQLRREGRLRTFNVARSGLLLSASPSIRHQDHLTRLDLSGIHVDTGVSCLQIAYICEKIYALSSIVLSRCSLNHDSLEPIQEALVGNPHLNRVELDLSGNELGSRGIRYFAASLRRCTSPKFTSISLSDIKMKDEVITELIASLVTLQELRGLYLSNVTSKNTSREPHLSIPLKNLLDHCRSLEDLDLSRGWGKGNILPVLAHINALHLSLRSLNVSHNQLGDRGAMHVAMFIRSNTQLYEFNVDDNKYGPVGFSALKNGVIRSTSLLKMPLPIDTEKILGAEEVSRRGHILELIMQMRSRLDANVITYTQQYDEYKAIRSHRYVTPEHTSVLPQVPSTVGGNYITTSVTLSEFEEQPYEPESTNYVPNPSHHTWTPMAPSHHSSVQETTHHSTIQETTHSTWSSGHVTQDDYSTTASHGSHTPTPVLSRGESTWSMGVAPKETQSDEWNDTPVPLSYESHGHDMSDTPLPPPPPEDYSDTDYKGNSRLAPLSKVETRNNLYCLKFLYSCSSDVTRSAEKINNGRLIQKSLVQPNGVNQYELTKSSRQFEIEQQQKSKDLEVVEQRSWGREFGAKNYNSGLASSFGFAVGQLQWPSWLLTRLVWPCDTMKSSASINKIYEKPSAFCFLTQNIGEELRPEQF
ncbi:hypothetical protein PROFUN_09760 [Planoprotostelium fungivorum]|uniref:Uncharacterized protein n=1 Tax=Planoprotostelium fungivorum TaxID=1890364 RepID=A0A2P6NFB6_9EUKA|nr:hypothetical protein PROFUN_09760 [Planoprotostelium fungivorum]